MARKSKAKIAQDKLHEVQDETMTAIRDIRHSLEVIAGTRTLDKHRRNDLLANLMGRVLPDG